MAIRTRFDVVGEGFARDAAHSCAPVGAYYTDPSVFELELSGVIERDWVLVAHSNELSRAGDYIVHQIGRESIYVIRGKDDRLRGYFNVCQHRGHQLLQGRGTVGNAVVCPYHAWSYGTDGALKGAPHHRDVDGFDRAEVQLAEVQVEVVGGFVFANLDSQAESLAASVPRFETILTQMVGRPQDLQLVYAGTFDIEASWKIVVENFLEAYHVDFSGPAHKGLGRIIDTATYEFDIDGRLIEYRAKGGAPEHLPYDANPDDAFADAAGPPFHQVFVFPHATFSVFPGTNVMFVYDMAPAGVGRCAERIHLYALPGEVSDATTTFEHYLARELNAEDIELVEAVQRGVASRGYRPGRLMVDPGASAGWGEQFVHHFNTLVLEALERAGLIEP